MQTGVAKRPNFLVFLTGRQTHNAWSGCGNSWLKTPAMDSIARRGNVFTNAVCPYPVCSASRSSIFTGRMPHETGVRPALTRFGATAKWVRVVTVNEQMAGLIYVKGHLPRRLEPGLHAFWPASGTVRAELGTLRVNIPAEFRIADPMPAARTVRNPGESLYRLLQLAVRRTLGTRTLDELLMEKVDIEPASAEEIRKEMAEVGVAVGTMALKDVIPPTEKAGSVTGGFDGMLEKLLTR